MLTYLFYRACGWLVCHIPLALSYRVAAFAAMMAYSRDSKRRAVAASNMRHVLGANATPEQVNSAVKGMFVNAVKNIVDMLRLPSLKLADVERMVTVNGWEHAEAALASGRGIVFTSAHFGELEVAVQIIASRGLSPMALHERLKPERYHQYVVGLRSRLGINFVDINDTTVLKRAVRALRQNGIVGVVADRDVTNSGRVVLFFGSPARLPDGYVSLALRTGATLMVGFSRRRTDTSYEVDIEPPVELARTGDRERDIEAGMVSVIAILERYISANPEQWVYFQPVWLSDLPAT
jgi:KDO2-lipid IV(A) lauroyltransferase